MPLAVVVTREVYGDGHEDLWMLLDTQPLGAPSAAAARRDEYHLRTTIEEGHRQLKGFWDLTHFTCQQRFATLTPLEDTELLLTLAEPARRKILAQARRLQRELLDALPNPRPP